MKINKSVVERIVREETLAVMKEFIDEAEKEKEPEVKGAEKDNDKTEPEAPADDIAPEVGAKKKDAPDEGEPPVADKDKDEPKPPTDEPPIDDEVPAGDDPADDEISKDVEDPDEEEPDGGDISNEIAQKTVQSITMDKDVKDFPGFKVIEIQFEDIPYPLRILVGQSGLVKFHFRGALHNSL